MRIFLLIERVETLDEYRFLATFMPKITDKQEFKKTITGFLNILNIDGCCPYPLVGPNSIEDALGLVEKRKIMRLIFKS